MTTTKNNEHEKNQGRKVLNVPNLRFPEFQGEWEKCELGEFATIIGGYAFKSETLNNIGGKYQVVKMGNLYQNQLDLHRSPSYTDTLTRKAENVILRKDDIAITLTGTNNKRDFGYTYIFNDEKNLLLNQRCGLIRAKGNPYFLSCLLKTHTFLNQFFESATGGTGNQANVSTKAMEMFSVNTPSLKEQEKIGQLMALLDERIATQNKIIDKLQSLIKGINQRVFRNNGINYKLGEVCEIRSGYSGNQLLSKKGLKVSRIETISGHKVNLERVGYVAPFESSENYKLQVGDILFSNINSVEYIGNTAFIDKDYDLYHGMNLLRLTPNNMVVIPFYLYLLLNTNRMLNRFKTVCNKAVSQASINQTELGKTVVQIPDINAQKQICELYQTLYDKLESEKYANSLFQKQKLYLLRQIFI